MEKPILGVIYLTNVRYKNLYRVNIINVSVTLVCKLKFTYTYTIRTIVRNKYRSDTQI